MDSLLGGFRWYRRWQKGDWIKITLRAVPTLEVWVKRKPWKNEIVLEKESYGD
jgi:hypothetical protein